MSNVSEEAQEVMGEHPFGFIDFELGIILVRVGVLFDVPLFGENWRRIRHLISYIEISKKSFI